MKYKKSLLTLVGTMLVAVMVEIFLWAGNPATMRPNNGQLSHDALKAAGVFVEGLHEAAGDA